MIKNLTKEHKPIDVVIGFRNELPVILEKINKDIEEAGFIYRLTGGGFNSTLLYLMEEYLGECRQLLIDGKPGEAKKLYTKLKEVLKFLQRDLYKEKVK